MRVRVSDDRIYRGTTQYDHFLRDRLFAYGRLSGERDGVADLDLRTITGSGLGYQLSKRSDFSFDIQGGLAWVHDDYGRDDSLDTDYPAAVVRWDLDKALNDAVHFFHEGEWVPSLREFNDLQLFTTETGLRIDLTKGWFAEAKLRWETREGQGRRRADSDPPRHDQRTGGSVLQYPRV